jgi:hypothetical protein
VVICSCDAYEDAWPPLFTLFDRYWPGVKDVPIVLNTETLKYQYDGFNILCPQLYKEHSDIKLVPWSKRLRETLIEAVETDLVLIYLDDFYLRSPVNVERLDSCLRYMDENRNAANILLFTCPLPYTPTKKFPWLVKREKKSSYLFSLQAGLWRKDRLLEFLRDHENPWHFEGWGTIRGRRYPDDFFALVTIDGKQAIFDYWPSMQGLSKSMWLPKTQELFEKEGIKINLSIRGIMPVGWQAPRPRRNWIKTAWNVFRSLRP